MHLAFLQMLEFGKSLGNQLKHVTFYIIVSDPEAQVTAVITHVELVDTKNIQDGSSMLHQKAF